MPNRPETEIVLQPGELHFGDRNTRIRTLLGSCVAITLWHPQRLIGGMCHFMLPSRGAIPRGSKARDGHYADEALDMLLEHVRAHGTQLHQYRAKVFGGGRMFAYSEAACALDVGQRNIEAAHRLLGNHGVEAEVSSVGRNSYCNVSFDIATGHVSVRHRQEPVT